MADRVSYQDEDWPWDADDLVLSAVRSLVRDVGEDIAREDGWGTAALPTSLELLEAVARIQARLEETTEELVAEAFSHDNATWDQIAKRLGMASKQAAHARYAKRTKQVLGRWATDGASPPSSES